MDKGGLGQHRGCPHLAMAPVSPELGAGCGSWGDVGDLMVVQGELGLAGGGDIPSATRWLSTPTPIRVAMLRVGTSEGSGWVQGSAWPGKVGRGSRQHGWGLPVPPARLGSAGRTAPGLRARSPRCQHAGIGVPVKQEALRGLRGSPAPALPTSLLREGSQCKTLLSPLLLGASPGCVVVTPGLHRELSAELGAGAGAAAGWAAGRRPCAVPSPSPAAVPEREPRCWCVPAAGSWAHRGHRGHREHRGHRGHRGHHGHHGHHENREHHGHRGSVPKPGLQFWAARPVLRSPGHGAAGPRPPLLCSP